ncbi:MAG: HAD family hydrolase [Mycobacterium leprae]
MTIRALFFDAGDTILHKWATSKRDRWAWLCRQAGISLPTDPEQVLAGARANERFFQDRLQHEDRFQPAWYIRMNRAGLAAMGLPGDLDEMAAGVHAVATQHADLDEWGLVDPEAEPLLAELRSRGYRLAVVSNWDGRLVDRMRPTGLSGYFDAMLDSAVVRSIKPDPRIFQIACAATGVLPEEALHVGDSPGADVAGALAAGVHPVLLDSLDLFSQGFRDLPPFPTIQRLSQLLDLLE